MAEHKVNIGVSFETLVEAVLSLERCEKWKLWEMLDDELENEAVLSDDMADIEAARADYEAGNYVTFDEYAAQRASRSR